LKKTKKFLSGGVMLRSSALDVSAKMVQKIRPNRCTERIFNQKMEETSFVSVYDTNSSRNGESPELISS
jgi:hypothetical protein